MAEDWNVSIRSLNSGTDDIVADVPVKRWMFNKVLNAPGAFEAVLNIADSGVTEANYKPGQREIIITRNGTRQWGGYLWSASVGTPERGAEVTIRGEGWFSRLRRRLVMSDLIYTNLAQETISWNLIDHTQNRTQGALGITQGTHTGSSIPRTESYCALDRPNIGESIDAFTQPEDGFDWYITPDKVFQTWQPRKEIANGFTFTGANTIDMPIEIDARNLATQVVYQGTDDCNPPFDAITASNLTTYGLLQNSLDVETSSWDKAKKLARENLRMWKNPFWQAEIEWTASDGPLWTAIELGDLIKITSANGFATFTDRQMRVIEMQASFEVGVEPRYRITVDDTIGDLT